MKQLLYPLLLFSFILLGGFRPGEQKALPIWQFGERVIEDGFPASANPLWARLRQCQVNYDETERLYKISLVADVRALEAQTVRASGFMLPLDESDKTKHFLLTRRAPLCRSCEAPGTPNEALEVRTTEPVDWTADIIAIKGRFKLINDGRNGFFFALLDAETAS